MKTTALCIISVAALADAAGISEPSGSTSSLQQRFQGLGLDQVGESQTNAGTILHLPPPGAGGGVGEASPTSERRKRTMRRTTIGDLEMGVSSDSLRGAVSAIPGAIAEAKATLRKDEVDAFVLEEAATLLDKKGKFVALEFLQSLMRRALTIGIATTPKFFSVADQYFSTTTADDRAQQQFTSWRPWNDISRSFTAQKPICEEEEDRYLAGKLYAN
ncbi:unnamed protein product, partial [Amoebophrya sp. A25]|eukprot:GSA25T00005033001.1